MEKRWSVRNSLLSVKNCSQSFIEFAVSAQGTVAGDEIVDPEQIELCIGQSRAVFTACEPIVSEAICAPEKRPGGRWYRDLGGNAEYFWAHGQSIKPPTLLEFYGPLFMSSPPISQVQFRLVAEAELVRVSMVHRVLGQIPAVFRTDCI
jgi:hypothetical protein